MPIRYRGSQIQSYSQAVDARTNDAPRVLAGQNFKFDVLGPKAGFGNKILTPFPVTKPIGVQGLEVRGKTFVFTQDTILTWRTNSPFTWEVVYNFSIAMPNPLYFPWFGFSMNEDLYLGHVSRGLYGSPIEENSEELKLKYLTADDIPGLPEGIRGAAKVRNRIILVTDGVIYWSATGDFSTLAPTPGGAGFQLISDFVTGDYLGISPFNEGFIVWTTDGAILSEYIDGDLVWRWSAFEAEERPIGVWAMQQMSNGMSVFLSARGLKYTANGQIPQDWTPEFNEFFRNYVNQNANKLTAADWRMAYDPTTEEVYLSETANSVEFWRTYVFHPTIDKWGIFSKRIYGLLPLTNDKFGFIDESGIARYFSSLPFSENMPGPEAGLNRTIPRIQKTIWPPSSSAVSRVRAYDPKQVIAPGQELKFFAHEVTAAGWHTNFDFGLQAYAQDGLDSWIEVGYLRPPEMAESNDGNIEIQEIVVSTIDSSPPPGLTYQIEGFEHLWEWNAEDWDSEPYIQYFDFAVDLMLFEGLYDLNVIAGPAIDHNDIQFPYVVWLVLDTPEDWDTMDAPAEDWHGDTMGLPPYKLVTEVKYSMDGRTQFSEIPELTRFDITAQQLAVMTYGNLHRIRFNAIEPFEYYHVSYLELTEQYGGQIG